MVMHIIKIAISIAATFLGSSAARAAGDVAHGEALYQGCQDCHSIDSNDVGPKHRGVVGRKAGSVPDYNYSPALKNSDFVWTEANLDQWLANPQKFVPGAKMFYHLDTASDRADVIQFLKERAR
jgi:cytochrome c